MDARRDGDPDRGDGVEADGWFTTPITHPDAATHRRIGERFAERAFGDGGPLAAKNG